MRVLGLGLGDRRGDFGGEEEATIVEGELRKEGRDPT